MVFSEQIIIWVFLLLFFFLVGRYILKFREFNLMIFYLSFCFLGLGVVTLFLCGHDFVGGECSVSNLQVLAEISPSFLNQIAPAMFLLFVLWSGPMLVVLFLIKRFGEIRILQRAFLFLNFLVFIYGVAILAIIFIPIYIVLWLIISYHAWKKLNDSRPLKDFLKQPKITTIGVFGFLHLILLAGFLLSFKFDRGILFKPQASTTDSVSGEAPTTQPAVVKKDANVEGIIIGQQGINQKENPESLIAITNEKIPANGHDSSMVWATSSDDAAKVNNTQLLVSLVEKHYREQGQLPNNMYGLEYLLGSAPPFQYDSEADRNNGVAHIYGIKYLRDTNNRNTYQLCTHFDNVQNDSNNSLWNHPAGEYCFQKIVQ